MAEQKRHDSLAPKGAFAGKEAAPAGGAGGAEAAERAAASTATLVARQAVVESEIDEGPELSVDDATDGEADLCADELIPSSADRVSMEDAMRALIDMRLERSRPSDDFGGFDLSTTSPAPTASVVTTANLAGHNPAMNSLAPIELAPLAPAQTATPQTRKRSPFLFLAAAAVVLLAIGIYRRADRQPNAPVSTQPVAAAAPHAAPAIAEPPAIDEMQAIGVSESEDAVLTLGTPTIINVPEADTTKPRVGPVVRAQKESTSVRSTVATTPSKPTPSDAAPVPEAPSREAIVAGFNSVRDEVLACAKSIGGVAPIDATIVSSGRITHATIGGYYQGTPEGSCIARALRKAQFAPFSRESIKVAFPYTL